MVRFEKYSCFDNGAARQGLLRTRVSRQEVGLVYRRDSYLKGGGAVNPCRCRRKAKRKQPHRAYALRV